MKDIFKFIFWFISEFIVVISLFTVLAFADYLFASYLITRYIVLFVMSLFAFVYAYSSYRHIEFINKENIKLTDKKGV